MKCPECFEDVMSDESECPYCGTYLGCGDSGDGFGGNYVSLMTVSNETEAAKIRDLLDSQSVPARISPYRADEKSADEWGEITVPEDMLHFASSAVKACLGKDTGIPDNGSVIPEEELEDYDEEDSEEDEI